MQQGGSVLHGRGGIKLCSPPSLSVTPPLREWRSFLVLLLVLAPTLMLPLLFVAEYLTHSWMKIAFANKLMYYYLHNRYLVYTFVTAVNFAAVTFNTW